MAWKTELEFNVYVTDDVEYMDKVITLKSEHYKASRRIDYNDIKMVDYLGLTPWDYMKDAIDVLSRMEME